ncbi:MAG TPA: YbjN domain-containing protein [Dermatophilaceae bacterium]|nr:YbjN domain-containing protein [Dermatophilaceae bacterium]
MSDLALVQRFLDVSGIPWEPGTRPGELVLTLPGEQKLRTVCSVVVSPAAVSVSAFVVRRPDENHEAFYRHLLRRNLRMPGLAYGVDGVGDVYLTGRVPLPPATGDRTAYLEALLDELLGVVLDACDGAFNQLLRLGFLTSMRREWAWRTGRGEPTANLEAFRHLLEPSEGERSGPPG